MSEGTALRTEGLTRTYRTGWLGTRSVPALKDLTLSVERGEVFGLLGPNGSGKTTTIKLLLGFLRPTSGRAEVLGMPAGDLGAKARLGFLPEETYLHAFLSAEETLDFYGRIFGLDAPTRRARSAELLGRVGLAEAARRPVREYSKGMARRLGLAQALVNDPELLILDEPTSGLDPIGSAETKALLLDLKRQGKTVLVSSHLLADMESVCDRVAILHQGRLVEAGTVGELLTRREATVLRIQDPPAGAVERAAETLRQAGAKVTSEHPTESLETHFLRVIREQGRGGKGS